ncbi:hypothetical protein [Lysobacter sp. ESA13C]|uniref:hypothetical protein n=1 Tax=Lysobacter sp. ESA13C TaxID=2862676 RepID=UPI001CBD5F6B|nr:hypothetical protein [Lysobacter sp. ESA13C]
MHRKFGTEPSSHGNGNGNGNGNGCRALRVEAAQAATANLQVPAPAIVAAWSRPLLPFEPSSLQATVAVRHLILAKAIEDPEGGAQGCAPFFIGTGMSRMKNSCGGTARAGL